MCSSDLAPSAVSLSVSNTAAADGFSESVGIQSASTTGAFGVTNGLGGTRVNAGATQTGALSVSLGAGAVAGANSGTLALQYVSDGTGTSGLGTIASNSQNVSLSATGYNAAAGSTSPSPVVLGNQRVGGTLSQALTVSNTAVAGAFSEDLRASFGTNTGSAQNNAGSASSVLAGASNASALSVGVNTATAGAKTGTVTVNYETLGAVNGVSNGLGTASAGSQTINVSGNVYNAAAANTLSDVVFANRHVGSAASQALSISNVAPSGSFTESLNASFGTATGNATTNGGSASLLAEIGRAHV